MNREATRWTYYRLNSFSHNLCTLDGNNQDALGTSKFLSFKSVKNAANGVVDLTTAYVPASTKTLRGVALVDNRRAVIIQDEFDFAANTAVAWGMTTDADIRLDGKTATLTQDGKTLVATILAPANAVFIVESAEQAPPQKKNEGVSRLMIRLDSPAGPARIAVLLAPVWPRGATKTADVIPLDRWEK